MNEKFYKRLGRVGGFGIAMGIIVLITGVSVGVLSIVNGAKAIHMKKDIMI